MLNKQVNAIFSTIWYIELFLLIINRKLWKYYDIFNY